MGGSFKLGRIAGIEVHVSWSVGVIVVLAGYALGAGLLPDVVEDRSDLAYAVAGLSGGVGLMASILVHELSHSVVARRDGITVNRITLWMLGGLAEMGEQARTAGSAFRIAIAGPLASLALAVVSVALAGGLTIVGVDLAAAVLAWLAVVNTSLAVFNMLPGAPLDGGRVLAAVIWWRTGDPHLARRRAARAGEFLGNGLIAIGLLLFALAARIDGLWLALIGWFVLSAARAEGAHETMAHTLGDLRVGDVMTRDVLTVDGARRVDEFVDHDLMRSHVSTFPVIDTAGRAQGVLTLRQLRRIPRDRWSELTVLDAATPVSGLRVAAVDDRLGEVLSTGSSADGRILVVDDEGRLVGVVSPTDLANVFTRLSIRGPRGVAP